MWKNLDEVFSQPNVCGKYLWPFRTSWNLDFLLYFLGPPLSSHCSVRLIILFNLPHLPHNPGPTLVYEYTLFFPSWLPFPGMYSNQIQKPIFKVLSYFFKYHLSPVNLLDLVRFSRSVVSDSLQPHGLQHARFPCPSPTPGTCLNSCPSNRWYHQTISSSVIPFSSCPQSFPASGSFPRSQFFTSGGQSIEVSASTLVLPSNEYSGLVSFRIDWFDPLSVQGTLKSLLQHHSSKASILQRSAFFMLQLSHPYMTTGKTIALTRQTFVGKAF